MDAAESNQARDAILNILGVAPDLRYVQQIADAGSILASMSHALNSAALMVATLLILWASFSAAANTAHEGMPFGRRYHSMWVPLRSAIAVGMLLPIAKGYSLIQILIVALAGLGFQSADLAWHAAIEHIRNTGPVVKITAEGSAELTLALYKSNLCMLRINSLRPDGGNQQRIVVRQRESAEPTGNTRYVLSFDGIGGSGLGMGTCGRFEITHGGDAVGKLMHTAQKKSIRRMSLELNRLALAQIGSGASQREIAQRLREIEGSRTAALQAAASRSLRAGEDSISQANRQFFREAKESGWMMAGSWFWTIGSINRRIADTLKNAPNFKLPDPTHMPADWSAELNEELLLADRAALRKLDSAGMAGARDSGFGGLHDKIAGWTHKPMNALIETVNETLNDAGEPVVQLQSLGHTLIGSAELLLAAAVAGQAMGIGSLEAASGNLLAKAGNLLAAGGGGMEFLSAVGRTLLDWASAIIVTLALPILGCGLMLAYWLPALPFIYWMAGIVGWLILLVEAVLVSPLWACAHAAAEGEGISGHFARPGYMMALSLVMRPLLMVFGLFAAMLITHWVSAFLLFAFEPFARGMHTGRLTGIVSIIAMLLLLTLLVVSLTNRIYALIHMLPGRVMNYVSDMPGWGGHGMDDTRMLAHIGIGQGTPSGASTRILPIGRK